MRCFKTTWQLGCEYKRKNYSACALMIYTKWTPCNGTGQLGLQKRYKGICCPSSGNETVAMVKTACKKTSNLSDLDFYELSPYVTSTELSILTPSLSTGVLLLTFGCKY